MPHVIRHRLASTTTNIPRLDHWENSLALLADPYRFIGRHCAALRTDVFETRLMLRRTLCMSGARAAELFYDDTRFQRANAAPEALKATLLGKGGVQSLDDTTHRQRKAMFLEVTRPERVDQLVQRVQEDWEAALRGWVLAGPMSLYRAMQPVLMRSVCRWAGVPLGDGDLRLRSRQVTALFDSAAAGPVRHLLARSARRQTEAWLARLTEETRAGHVTLPADSPAKVVMWHGDLDGNLLPPRIAAVELLNVLRPVVAVSVFISFVAHALHRAPQWRERLAAAGASSPDALAFVQEVRRDYPFFPAVMARVRTGFDWMGMHFVQGRRAMLDLYGTNHDPRAWNEPYAFMPERWLNGRHPSAYAFVPQGGAHAQTQHRCPGEDITGRLMLVAVHMLTRRMRYDVVGRGEVPIEMNRLPAVPQGGFMIDNVRVVT